MIMYETISTFFELSQKQNLLYAALNTIFTTQDAKRIKNVVKECSASRYEIQTGTLNTDCKDVMLFKPYLNF